MAIIREKIPIHKHFLVIDSPVPFTLIANNGTDEVYRMAGAWRVDLWKLLPKEFFKQYPVFDIEIEYDDTDLNGGSVVIRQSDIDLGEGIAGVNGQDVKVTNFSDLVIPSPDISTLAKETTLNKIFDDRFLEAKYDGYDFFNKNKLINFIKNNGVENSSKYQVWILPDCLYFDDGNNSFSLNKNGYLLEDYNNPTQFYNNDDTNIIFSLNYDEGSDVISHYLALKKKSDNTNVFTSYSFNNCTNWVIGYKY